MKNHKFYLEAFPLLIFLATACGVAEVEEAGTLRCDTCLSALECASNCEVPMDALHALGCGPADFYSVPPQCNTKSNCNDAKSDCYHLCDEQTETLEEEIDCKVECTEMYGNDSLCEENFQKWVVQRQSVLGGYNECVRPCALGATIPYCLQNPGACSEEQYAALLAVEKVTLCQMGDSDACGFMCEDLVNSFHCHQ